MSKVILMSIKPKYVAEILNHRKTIEIRKTMPKCELPIDVYIYCTKGKRTLRRNTINGHSDFYIKKGYGDVDLNGFVVAKFTLRKITLYIAGNNMDPDHPLGGDAFIKDGVLDKSCLTEEQLLSYTEHNEKRPYDFTFYAWHISDLVIFDEPKELSAFMKPNWDKGLDKALKRARKEDEKVAERIYNGDASEDEIANCEELTLLGFKLSGAVTRAPQSWCYVEESE